MIVRLKSAVAALLTTALACAALAQDVPAPPTAPVPPPEAPPPAATEAPAPAAPVFRRPRVQAPAVQAPEAVAVPARPPRPGARLAPGQPIPRAELEAFVDGAVRQAMSGDHIAGTAVSVVQLGQPDFKKGYGVADLTPLRPVDPDQTLFRIGSITKTFTWIAVMRQIEAGRMRLDAPVNQYLPERLRVRDQGYEAPIRIRDLMTHSPGFEDKALGQLFERRSDAVRPLETYLRRERPRRVRPPGQTPVYSNYGVALAGEAVAEVTGVAFEDWAEREVFRPLGMARTTAREPRPAIEGLPAPMPAALAGSVSEGFRWTGAQLSPRGFEYIGQVAPAGSVSSTAGDMARYMTAVLNDGTLEGATLYSPATARAFRTVILRSAPGVNGWAHGFVEYGLPGGFTGFGHSGATLSFHANMVTVPELGLGVFAAGNTDTAGRLVASLPGLIVEHFYGSPPTPPMPGAASLKAQAQVYDGVYLTERRAYGGLEKFVSMVSGLATVRTAPDGRLIIATRTGGDAWSPTPVAGQFVSDDGRVSAFSLKNGRADRWFAASGATSYGRVGPLARVETLGLVLGAALVASGAVLVGLFLRNRRDFRQTQIQAQASAMQTAAAVLWIAFAVSLSVWAVGASDPARLFYDWPGVWLLLASACALVAAMASLGAILLLPLVWKGGRRVDSWTAGRKARFTVTAVIFGALSGLLALWGALEPWSG